MMFPTMTLSALRYSSRPFPAYRFIPGQFPHPTAHPLGHSYHPPGSPRPQVQLLEAHRWRESADYLYGCDLYNHGYWWEAHEAWEGPWQLTDKKGPQGLFLQGIIQVAACHAKLYLGNREGVSRLRNTSVERLNSALAQISESTYMGLDVRDWMGRVVDYYEERCNLASEAPAHDPEFYPYIRLDWDSGT